MQLHSHDSPVQSPADRGAELGAAYGEQIRESASRYLNFFTEIGVSETEVKVVTESSISALREWRPKLAEELAAMAQAAQLETWQMAAVNSRTEVLAAAGVANHECSTIAYAPQDGIGWGLQTWDWHPSLVPNGLVWTLRSDSGRRVKTFTEFGAQGKIGINDAGIGVLFNILSHQSDQGFGGVPVHSVARAVLDEATSLDEASEIIHSAGVRSSTALTVVEAREGANRAISFEMSGSGVGEVLPDSSGVLVRANHFLDPALATGETVQLVESKTLERYAHLRDTAQSVVAQGADTRSRADALYAGGSGEVLCFTPTSDAPISQQWQTLITVGLDLPNFTLELSPDAPAPSDAASFTSY